MLWLVILPVLYHHLCVWLLVRLLQNLLALLPNHLPVAEKALVDTMCRGHHFLDMGEAAKGRIAVVLQYAQ